MTPSIGSRKRKLMNNQTTDSAAVMIPIRRLKSTATHTPMPNTKIGTSSLTSMARVTVTRNRRQRRCMMNRKARNISTTSKTSGWNCSVLAHPM